VSNEEQFQNDLHDQIRREVNDRFQRKMDRLQDRMARRRQRSPFAGLLFGGLIVLIGVLILLDNLGFLPVRDVWQYWPVLLIAMGLSRAIGARNAACAVWGGLLTLIGVILLLDNLNIAIYIFDHRVRLSFNLLWPLLLVGFGLSVVAKNLDRAHRSNTRPTAGSVDTTTTESEFSVTNVFSGSRRNVESPDFRGGEIVSIFGGVRLDLRRAKMTVDEAVIDVNAVFGGVEIRVPEYWNVEARGAGVFGGFDDKTIHPRTDVNVKTPQLVVTGAAVFGGVSITN
jgi:predicted membrane protein